MLSMNSIISGGNVKQKSAFVKSKTKNEAKKKMMLRIYQFLGSTISRKASLKRNR